MNESIRQKEKRLNLEANQKCKKGEVPFRLKIINGEEIWFPPEIMIKHNQEYDRAH